MPTVTKEKIMYRTLQDNQAIRIEQGSKWGAKDYELVLEMMEEYKLLALKKRKAEPLDGNEL